MQHHRSRRYPRVTKQRPAIELLHPLHLKNCTSKNKLSDHFTGIRSYRTATLKIREPR
jgi:hypothetical protein